MKHWTEKKLFERKLERTERLDMRLRRRTGGDRRRAARAARKRRR